MDYDLHSAIEYHISKFGVEDVCDVLAVIEGENDGENWHWLLLLNDGTFAYLTGGCDYTGWDCQSWASAEVGATPLLVLPDTSDGHDLLRQFVENDKAVTWRDGMSDFEMPRVNL